MNNLKVISRNKFISCTNSLLFFLNRIILFVKINIFIRFRTVASLKYQIDSLNKQKRFFGIIDSSHLLKDLLCLRQTSLVTQSRLFVNGLVGLAHVLFVYAHVILLKFCIRNFGLMLVWVSLNVNNLLIQFQIYSKMILNFTLRVSIERMNHTTYSKLVYSVYFRFFCCCCLIM